MIRVFSHWLPANTLLQVGIDLILACIFLALAIAWQEPDHLHGIAVVLPYAVLFIFGLLVLNSLFGVYSGDAQRCSPRNSVVAFITLCFLPVVPMAYGMLSPNAHFETWQEELGMALLLSLGLTAMIRSYAVRNGVGMLRARRVMVLGTGSDAAAVEHSLVNSGQHVHFVGFYPSYSDEATQVAPDRVLAVSDSIVSEVRRLKVNEIIVAVREQRTDAILARELLDCKLAGVSVLDLSSHFERAFGQVRLNSLRASWLIFGKGFRQGPIRKLIKRLFDIFAAMLLLAVLWPVMLLSAALIVIESGFPIFYCQKRVGHNGQLFRVVKFRSMRRDAERDGKPRWASCNDLRVTHVGSILRRLRIDELPQFWNLLKGEMSLCGPRPERPDFVAQLVREIPFYEARHSIKPGVTGWAQLRYRYGESVEDAAQKLQYDLYYVKNHTLFLDAVILFKTVGVVLTGTGAR